MHGSFEKLQEYRLHVYEKNTLVPMQTKFMFFGHNFLNTDEI